MIHMAFHETSHSGAGVPPAAGASRPGIRRGRDARADSREGCPTPDRSQFMVPMHAEKNRKEALHEPVGDKPTADPSREGNWPIGTAPLLGGVWGWIHDRHARAKAKIGHR